MAMTTSRSAASMAIALSMPICSLLSGGRLGRMRSSSARTPRAISSVFAFDCASTASVTPGWPLSRL